MGKCTRFIAQTYPKWKNGWSCGFGLFSRTGEKFVGFCSQKERGSLCPYDLLKEQAACVYPFMTGSLQSSTLTRRVRSSSRVCANLSGHSFSAIALRMRSAARSVCWIALLVCKTMSCVKHSSFQIVCSFWWAIFSVLDFNCVFSQTETGHCLKMWQWKGRGLCAELSLIEEAKLQVAVVSSSSLVKQSCLQCLPVYNYHAETRLHVLQFHASPVVPEKRWVLVTNAKLSGNKTNEIWIQR